MELFLEIVSGVFLGGLALWFTVIDPGLTKHRKEMADSVKDIIQIHGLDSLGHEARMREEEREEKDYAETEARLTSNVRSDE